MSRLDHILVAAPTLESGMLAIETACGVTPSEGGPHPGLGTRNALISLDNNQYLEIIAPDPNQELSGTLGERLSRLDAPTILTWAAAAENLNAIAESVRNNSLITPGPIPQSRELPNGSTLDWYIMPIAGHPLGLLVPFLIDWGDSLHPSADAPSGCSLKSLTITTPESDALRSCFDSMELDILIQQGDTPEIEAVLQTPRGEVTLKTPVPMLEI